MLPPPLLVTNLDSLFCKSGTKTLGKAYNPLKKIIAIEPWGSQKTSQTVKDSREIYRSSYPVPQFNFQALDHKDLGETLGLLDMESGSKVAKPGFYFLKGDLALLELALMRFAIDRVTDAGYELHITPEIANDKTMEGTGYVPRGDESNTFTIGYSGQHHASLRHSRKPLQADHD